MFDGARVGVGLGETRQLAGWGACGGAMTREGETGGERAVVGDEIFRRYGQQVLVNVERNIVTVYSSRRITEATCRIKVFMIWCDNVLLPTFRF